MPFYRHDYTGNRKTAFFCFDLLAHARDNRIDENLQLILMFGRIDHNDTFGQVDLGRGQSNSRSRIHGLRHVINQPANWGVYDFNRERFIPKSRVGIN